MHTSRYVGLGRRAGLIALGLTLTAAAALTVGPFGSVPAQERPLPLALAKAELPKAEMPKAEMPNAELPKAEPAKAEPPKAPLGELPTEHLCRFTETPPTLDGDPSDEVWKSAAVIDRFGQPWLGADARPLRSATRARVLWDREALYFLAEMADGDLWTELTERDARLWEGDVFELFFKPADDRPGYYEFQVNPAAAVLDMFIPARAPGSYEKYAKKPGFAWTVKVRRAGTLNDRSDRDSGWVVEGRIPWTDFLPTGGPPRFQESWGFALCRYNYDHSFPDGAELSTCAPLTGPNPGPTGRANFHAHEQYARLRFVGAAPSSAEPAEPAVSTRGRFDTHRRVPLTSSTVEGWPEPPPPYRAVRAHANLSVNLPLMVKPQPGSDRLWIISQDERSGPTRIVRTRQQSTENAPAGGATRPVETLLTHNDNLYDLAFHPRFEQTGWVFVSGKYRPAAGQPKRVRVQRFAVQTAEPFALDAASAQTIIEWTSDGHDGAALAFGRDGTLFITTGDGTSDSDENLKGQDTGSLLAKVLRIDVDASDAATGRAYRVPADNPFVGRAEFAPETWAYGLRNPWRMCCDPVSGDLWVGNNGQDLWEQIYRVRRGDNFGWSVFEGSAPFQPSRKLAGPSPHTPPTVEHHHVEARSLTGGVVYRGRRFPELVGAYIYGDYSTGRIWAARHDGRQLTESRLLAITTLTITGFGTDADGELMICDYQPNSGLWTLEARPASELVANAKFPRRLSDSGLFDSVAGHVLKTGLIPYTVNSPLWSDGAHKERAIGLPGADAQIGYTDWRSWNFPDRTVLVKSFALETVVGDPASRRWVETRFLTRQEGQWYGYSYRWNAEQSDAELVAAGGADQVVEIREPDGSRRQQKWHFPSRAECMVCHSRAMNFVLGLSTAQLNGERDYGGGLRDNQLRVLERLGVLAVDWNKPARRGVSDALKTAGKSPDEIKEWLEAVTPTAGTQRAPEHSGLLPRPPERLARMPNPLDATAGDLTARAKSYLHANCASCHVHAGGGNAQIDLEWPTKLEKMRLLNVAPMHTTFGIAGAKLLVPGEPEKSILWERVRRRGEGQMPPLASCLADPAAVQLLREWIVSLPAAQ